MSTPARQPRQHPWIHERFRQPPRLGAIDLFLVIVPTIAWAAAFKSRPVVMTLSCGRAPSSCTPDKVAWIDRVAIGLESARADAWSFHTQHLAGVLAILLPLLWVLSRAARGRLKPREAWGAIATDLVLFLQMTLWNGLVTESLRLLVQRPRPFVYTDPARLGQDAAHYTSFLSGHTSFAAAAGAHLLLTLTGRVAPRHLLIALSVVAVGITGLTGLFRVLAGRHFPTDTLAATVAGVGVATAIAWLHRGNSYTKIR